jgi:hypothetical protein
MSPLTKKTRNAWFVLMMLLPFMFCFSSCSKEGGNCFSNSGPVIMQERIVADFDTIAMYDYVNLLLTQDTVNSVRVEAGQNIISGISAEVENRVLVIRNHNTCNWLRSYNKPIIAHVSVKNLRSIYYNSSADVSCTDTIRTPWLMIDTWGGCGTIDLTVKVNEGFFITHLGTADIRLHGICNISSVFAGDYGLIQCSGLETGYSYAKNYGSNDCYVKASKYLQATIGSVGNIYYLGEPDSLQTYIYGSGAVLHGGN